MVHLGTLRYNNQTWEELDTYLKNNSIKGCVYNVPIRIATVVPIKNPVIIFEMNNTINKIMAIGLIENYLRMDKYYKIHKTNNYNRYSYLGHNRIVREDFNEQEEMVFKAFDYMVFKGSSHMKRGQGVTCISQKKLKNYQIDGLPIDEFVYKMFIDRF